MWTLWGSKINIFELMFNFLFISWTISIVGLKSWKPCIYSAKSEKAEIVTFLNITPHIIYEK